MQGRAVRSQQLRSAAQNGVGLQTEGQTMDDLAMASQELCVYTTVKESQ